MIERAEYLANRRENKITIDAVYEYYKEHNRDLTKDFDAVNFAQLFHVWSQTPMFNINNMFEYFDKKFSIMVATDIKTGKILNFS